MLPAVLPMPSVFHLGEHHAEEVCPSRQDKEVGEDEERSEYQNYGSEYDIGEIDESFNYCIEHFYGWQKNRAIS